MLVRCSAALLVLTATAAADPTEDVPGTGGDPIVALTLRPELVDAPLFPGLSMRGGDPADTKVLFDGFEVPLLFHGDHALRSTLISNALSDVDVERTDVELGRGTSFVTLTPHATSRVMSVQVSDIDATIATPLSPGLFSFPGYGAARYGYGPNGDRFAGTDALDETFALQRRHGHWRDSLSAIAGFDARTGTSGRIVARTLYARHEWDADIAVSPLIGYHRWGIDTRAAIGHSAPAAGLRSVHWQAGIDSTNQDLDVGWLNDVAAWSSITASLSPNIEARGGIRVDAFLRGDDIATQPRGSLRWQDNTTTVKLEAGAFRRPPEKPSEVGLAYLHPERTTQVIGTVVQRRQFGNNQLAGSVTGYYIDRTHLVARDSFGNWGNTGIGSSTGVEVATSVVLRGRWFAYLGASVSTSKRRDYPRGRERSADFDQPVRLDAMARYRAKRWRVAARFSLSSGLPYTPIVESTYESDSDSFAPVFAFANSSRLPWMHSLDIRADVYLGRGFRAFGELRNAYAASTALGYEYSYDFKDRLDVTLPILPFVGITYLAFEAQP